MSDPYLYPDAPVLKNKLGIKDRALLSEAEEQFVFVRNVEIDAALQGIDLFSARSLQSIHRHLFGDVYEWAGEFRHVNIQKSERVLNGLSVQYSPFKEIAKQLGVVMADARATDWRVQLGEDIRPFASYIARLWQIHPYREGNTRCISTYMNLFVAAHGYELDEQLLARNASYLRNALVMASIGEYSETEHLERILQDAVEPESQGRDASERENESQDYTHIGEYEVSEYEELPFTVEEEDRDQQTGSLDEAIEEARERAAGKTEPGRSKQGKSHDQER